MSEPCSAGIAPANHIHANNYASFFFSRELIGDRRATDEVVAAAQPHFIPHCLDNTAVFRWKFKFLRGESEFSQVDWHFGVFQHGLQNVYLSFNAHVKGGLFLLNKTGSVL